MLNYKRNKNNLRVFLLLAWLLGKSIAVRIGYEKSDLFTKRRHDPRNRIDLPSLQFCRTFQAEDNRRTKYGKIAEISFYRICPSRRDSRPFLYADEAGRRRVAAMPFLSVASYRLEGTRHPGCRSREAPPRSSAPHSDSGNWPNLWRNPPRRISRCHPPARSP